MKKIIKMAAAAALTGLTLAPAPALADNDRTQRVIVGAVALAIIGSAIHRNQQRQQTPLSRDTQRVEVQPYAPRGLPAECLRHYQTYQGDLRLFDGACLEHRYPAYRHLPLGCAVTVRDGNQFSSGFRPRCLRDAGYRLAGS